MAIRRKKIGIRLGMRRRVPASGAKQEMLKANLKRFQDLATRSVATPEPTPPTAPPSGPARAAPVGEILPPERSDLEAFSPGARMAEANRHVRQSVRQASTIIRESEVFFLGAKQTVAVAAEPEAQRAAETVRQAERSVADALEFALGPRFTDARPALKREAPLAVEETVREGASMQAALTAGAAS